MTNVYAIRQAILRDFKNYALSPIRARELVEISCEPAIVYNRDEALKQVSELQIARYLAAVEGFGGEYLTITGKGLRQVAPEYGRDVFIWGPGAARRVTDGAAAE